MSYECVAKLNLNKQSNDLLMKQSIAYDDGFFVHPVSMTFLHKVE